MKYKNNDLIGITGIMGAGKSFFANSFDTIYNEYKNKINIIEIDDIRRNLLWKSKELNALKLRQEIINQFSIGHDENLFFNRELFTGYLFSNIELINKFNKLCKPYFIEEIKSSMCENKVNFLIWVNLIEENYLGLLNHIVFIDVTEEKWLKRNSYNLELFQLRLKFQNNSNIKKELLKNIKISYEVHLND